MYKVCVYQYVNRAQLRKIDEFRFEGLSDLVEFFEENDPVDPEFEITVDFIKEGE